MIIALFFTNFEYWTGSNANTFLIASVNSKLFFVLV
jgi:hypothetical protein